MGMGEDDGRGYSRLKQGVGVPGESIATCPCLLHAKGQKFSHMVVFIFKKQPSVVHKHFFPQHQMLTYAILINIFTLERDKRHFGLISLYFLKLLFSSCIFSLPFSCGGPHKGIMQ